MHPEVATVFGFAVESIMNPWGYALIGALLGQRALVRPTMLMRAGHYASSVACGVLFGPAAADWVGANKVQHAAGAVIGAAAAAGVAVVDSMQRYLRKASFLELLDRVHRAVGVLWGNK
jgi:hypothetical protein